MKSTLVMEPIAYIKTDFKEKFGLPRQSGRVEALKGEIIFLPKFRNEESLRGIDQYSHLWLIFDFSEAHRKEWSPTVRPPRLGGNKRMGVFATRSPFRPNPIGLSCVKIEEIRHTASEGTSIIVSGIDILDNTPILDIKPYIPYADSYPDAKGGFGEELQSYHLEVDFQKELLELIPADKQQALIDCLAEDPRPSYHNDGRTYSMKYSDHDVHFKVCGNILTVTGID